MPIRCASERCPLPTQNHHRVVPTAGLQQQPKVVLIADLVGSVSLMQRDDVGVIQRWQEFVANVIDDILPNDDGRLVKSLGDGLLAEFDSAPRAVSAASSMHRCIDEACRNTDEPPMRLRIGLNATQVYEGEHDIYGTGVNVAARIAALARPGCTVVTASVRDAWTDGLDGELEDLGHWYLKHIEEAVRVYGVRASGEPTVCRTASVDTTPMCPTIAVMPFESRNVEVEAFDIGDLIAEGVIGQLCRTPDLKVISHLSTSAFRRSNRTLYDARSHLGADYVLSGSYVVSGRAILVMAELVHVSRDEIIWS